MNASYLSRLLLTALAGLLGSSGIFLTWASFRAPVAGSALACLVLATVSC